MIIRNKLRVFEYQQLTWIFNTKRHFVESKIILGTPRFTFNKFFLYNMTAGGNQ